MRLFILVALCLCWIQVTSVMNFQKIIWLYWETDFSKAPLLTRISYEKLLLAGQKSNWTVNLVTGQNAKNFIPDYQRFQEVVKKGYRNTVQEKSDILRITLVEANGGVWIDFACILFEDLTWLSNEKLFQSFLINRIGSNLNDPDMLMIGQGYHQSPLSYYNQDGVLVTDEYFGMAIHFIAAKKKAPIMTAWKQKMYNLTTLKYKEFLPETQTKRLYFHNIERQDMYYSGNMALESVIQEKQMQFDDNLTLKSKRINVYEHFKIWMVHGEVGPILMTRKHLINSQDLFMDTLQEIQERAQKVRFFLKFAKFMREAVQDKQTPTQQYFKANNLTVEQILERGPTFKECQLFYLVKGSILYNFYLGSKYEPQIKIPIITVEQRQKMRSHCWYKAPQVYFSYHSLKSQGQMTRPERQLMADKSDGFLAWVNYMWKSNSLVFWAWSEWFRALSYLVIAYCLGRYAIFRLNVKRIGGMESTLSRSSDDMSSQRERDSLESNRKFRFEGPHAREVIIVTMLIFVASAGLQFYEELQDMGKYPQYECTLLAVLGVFLARGLIKKLIEATPGNTFFNLKKVLKVTRIITFVPVAFAVFLHFDIVYSFSFYYSVVVGGGGLLLFGLLEQLEERKISTKFLNVVRKCLKFTRWGVIGIFIAFYLAPNLRYLRSEGRYIKENISEMVFKLFLGTFILTILCLLFKLVNLLKQGSQEISKNQTVHLIFNTIAVSMLVLQSHLVFNAVLSSPSSYPTMGYFLLIMVIFTLCIISIQQRVPEQLTGPAQQLLGISNIAQTLFMILGIGFLELLDLIPQRWLWIQLIPLYVVYVMLKDEWVEKNEFNKLNADSSEMFHGVQLSPNSSKD